MKEVNCSLRRNAHDFYYNVCAKMTIFQKLGHIAAGVEIVPVKAFVEQMSTGVSYFEQFVWDLEARGCLI